jgi:hypothetical protein
MNTIADFLCCLLLLPFYLIMLLMAFLFKSDAKLAEESYEKV